MVLFLTEGGEEQSFPSFQSAYYGIMSNGTVKYGQSGAEGIGRPGRNPG